MARDENEIVRQILRPGNCITILDGKELGALLGELLKMLRVAQDNLLHENDLFIVARDRAEVAESELKRVRAELDTRTPEGLKEKLRKKLRGSKE